MVSALFWIKWSGFGGHCIVFLSKTLYSHSASLHPGVLADLMLGLPCNGLASHPGEIEILPVFLCYRNRDKLWPDKQLGSYADFTYLL